MAAILCIETTTTNCSVALTKEGIVVALREDNSKTYSHAEKLHVFIDEVLTESGVSKNQIDAIAVSKGPGSYTGLRIGVSAAKGLCYALDIPLISISTLEALALQVENPDGYIIPMIDARRMEVFTAVFDKNFKQLTPVEALILSENSFEDYLSKGKVYFLGNANEKFKAICTHTNALFIEDKLPSAKQMSALAEIAYKKSDFENAAYFEPYYLKDFISG